MDTSASSSAVSTDLLSSSGKPESDRRGRERERERERELDQISLFLSLLCTHHEQQEAPERPFNGLNDVRGPGERASEADEEKLARIFTGKEARAVINFLFFTAAPPPPPLTHPPPACTYARM